MRPNLIVSNPSLARVALATLLSLAPLTSVAGGLDGVWHGMIGTTEVQLCLQENGGSAVGAYYALGDGKIISLELRDQTADNLLPEHWIEVAPDSAASLTFRLQAADRLAGERKGSASTLIALTRVPLLDKDRTDPQVTSCSSLTFSAPRLAEAAEVTRISANWHGRAYTHLIFAPAKLDVHLETFQLLGSSPAIRRINAELGLGFPGLDPEADILDCSRSNLGWSGRDGLDTELRWPETLTDAVLVIGTSYEVYCGGAYPETSTRWQTINPRTGDAVDTAAWLANGALESLLATAELGGKHGALPIEDPFTQLFFKHYPAAAAEDNGCADVMSSGDDWYIRPSRNGMVFTPDLPHVAQVCSIDVTIPYDEVWPFLSVSGKAMATEVRKALNRSN